jgi:hypothetical protein
MKFMNHLDSWYSRRDLENLKDHGGLRWLAREHGPEYADLLVAVNYLASAGLEILQSNPELTHVNIERGSIVGFR